MDATRKRRWILYGLMPALVTFGIAFARGPEAPFPEPDRTLIRQAGLGKDGETRAFADDVLPWISEQWKRAREILLEIPQPFLK